MDWRQIRNYFLPETLETVNSPLNGEIKVVKWHNKISVWVGGFQQSGPLVDQIFKPLSDANYKNVLILGLGCGSILKYLRAEKITGVEIDPAMIDIGKKYFNLKNVKIIIGDATIPFDFAQGELFDLIVVDIYNKGLTEFFIPNLNNLTDDGCLLFNQLCFGKNQKDLVSYLDPDKVGVDRRPDIKVKEIKKSEYNKLIFCSKKRL